MTQKDPRQIQAELAMPFAPEDLEWRLQKVVEAKELGIAVPYVTNRAIMGRLDDVVGPENWYNEFKPWHGDGKKDAQLCGISIRYGDGFITKWDGAEDSDIEPVKGGLSDSMKRAAVQWGIGRVLYNMDVVFVDVEKRGKTWCIKKDQQSRMDNAYLSMLGKLDLTPAPAGGLRPKAEAEGPLKGDVASYLAHDALFVCIGGVNAIHGLKDTLVDLGVTQVVEAMDMDQMTNPNVRSAVLAMRKEVQAIRGLKYTKYTWDPAYKGVDDYLLSRVAAM